MARGAPPAARGPEGAGETPSRGGDAALPLASGRCDDTPAGGAACAVGNIHCGARGGRRSPLVTPLPGALVRPAVPMDSIGSAQSLPPLYENTDIAPILEAPER